MNINLLKSKMALHGDTLQNLADVLGIAICTMSFRLNGKAEFKQNEIAVIIERYNLSSEETAEIFFRGGDGC